MLLKNSLARAQTETVLRIQWSQIDGICFGVVSGFSSDLEAASSSILPSADT